MTRLLFSVMPANEVLMQHSFRTGNQFRLHHEPALSAVKQRYAQIEKECLAIVFGCQKFLQYITGREKVAVESDHKPLQSTFKK